MALIVCGLQEWVIKLQEDSTLAKIAILYQLALASKEYAEETRSICKEMVEKAGEEEKRKINIR